MRIEVSVDAAPLILKVEKGQKRLAFGVAEAINNTAKRVQRGEQAMARRQFRIRKRQFILRQVAIIKPFANARQGRPYAEISVGQRPRLFLSTFERGGIRKPFKGDRVAVPITGSPARPAWGKGVPKALTFQALKFKKSRPRAGSFTKSGKQRRTKGGQGVRFGLLRTYLLPRVGVFQRGIRDDSKAALLYIFVPPPRLTQQLRFIATAKCVSARWFKEEMEKQVIETLKRAGFKTGGGG